MADTLLLDVARWDVILDASGNIAIATKPYAIAQDVGSAVKTFRGEVFYNLDQGIPYFAQVLGQYPPAEIVRAYIIAAALAVPDVISAVCYFSGLIDRALSGQVIVTDNAGVTSIAGF